MAVVRTLEDLFVHSLSDVYSAEKQLTKALPKMAKAATDEQLSAAFTEHLEETKGQIQRLDQIVESCGIKLMRMKCAAMEGLVEESKEIIEEIEDGAVLDCALIGAAQKVEHYEIASYGTLVALANQLGYDEAAQLLQETLEEEKATDQKLTTLAEQGANQQADDEEGDEEDSDEDDGEEIASDEEDDSEEEEDGETEAAVTPSQKGKTQKTATPRSGSKRAA